MFNIGDSVVYGASGVCTILDIREETFSGAAETYYILLSECDRQTTFVPVRNENLVARMKRTMTCGEAAAFIETLPDAEPLEWCEQSRARTESFKQILTEGNRTELARMLKTLYNHKKHQQSIGKKLYLSDETMMKRAEKLLHSELAYSLSVRPEELLPLIEQKLGY